MCGICGVILSNNENPVTLLWFMMSWQQHRGQEAAGMAISNGQLLVGEKWEGLVSRFGEIQQERLRIKSDLPSRIGIGHVRYSNTGSNFKENYQPFIRSTKFGKIALVHNGNLTNTTELTALLKENGYEPDGTTDSELIVLLIAYFSRLPEIDSIAEAIRRATSILKGSFSLVIMTKDILFGLRDPWGVRPLSFAKLNGNGFAFASETCAFNPIGAEWICDLNAGEMIEVPMNGFYTKTQLLPKISEDMCIFEYIYFASPSSVIHKRSLETARRHMGEQLWIEHPFQIKDHEEWIVGGVPNTGIPAALGFAAASGIEFRRIFVKNETVGRTFIQPDQRMRDLGVKIKLQTLEHEVADKIVVCVEDSIVRATTSPQLVKMLLAAGAREVHMMITSPPYKYCCNLGTDTQTEGDLIASKLSVEETCHYIGANSLYYLSKEGLIKAIKPVSGFNFCAGCFDNHYPFSISN